MIHRDNINLLQLPVKRVQGRAAVTSCEDIPCHLKILQIVAVVDAPKGSVDISLSNQSRKRPAAAAAAAESNHACEVGVSTQQDGLAQASASSIRSDSNPLILSESTIFTVNLYPEHLIERSKDGHEQALFMTWVNIVSYLREFKAQDRFLFLKQ